MRIIKGIIESYDDVFGPKKQIEKMLPYLKSSNWKVKAVLLLLPVLLVTAYIFIKNDKPLYLIIVLILIYILPYLSRILIEKDISENEFLEFRDFRGGLMEWKVLLKEKTGVDLDIYENTLAVEEIIKYEIEYDATRPTFLSHVATPTTNIIFPAASFILGLYISESFTNSDLFNLIVLLFIGFLTVFSINFIRYSYFDFTKTYKIKDILSLVLECKLLSGLNR